MGEHIVITSERFIHDTYRQIVLDEESVTRECPYVIDSGIAFTDRHGHQHIDGCGWKTIHTALKFLQFIGKLPKHLKEPLQSGELDAEFLKELCDVSSLSKRLEPAHLKLLGEILRLQFIIHEPGMATERKVRYGARRNCYTIHLYLFTGHYTLFIDEPNHENAKKFARTMKGHNIEFCNLANRCILNTDRQFALSLANDEDLSLALSLSDD
ncbi:Hypothetical protein PACV_222 [Pacmanvirus A23]|uniref:Hypothetical protein n=1 Tax=Pacmanvirus A23 TaxID=1932881 RepID=UPI000A095E57|nr:Hypothetical protein B9W72_gp220 [Pacmanvirus A23]SIP85937.1 Hypothetical protein PACV_222 [Pacmanvirus A23]